MCMAYLGGSVERDYFFGASPRIKARAKELRKRMTPAEKVLWQVLRKNQRSHFYFRRQHPISRFIVDFYCHELKLVVEVDGGYHFSEEQKLEDDNRAAELDSYGIKVIRYTNDEVCRNTRKVEWMIDGEILRRMGEVASPPQPSPKGEGA
jgi:very-short-patch-repair endonuclease